MVFHVAKRLKGLGRHGPSVLVAEPFQPRDALACIDGELPPKSRPLVVLWFHDVPGADQGYRDDNSHGVGGS